MVVYSRDYTPSLPGKQLYSCGAYELNHRVKRTFNSPKKRFLPSEKPPKEGPYFSRESFA